MDKLANTPKNILAELGVLAGGLEITRYLSTRGFITGASDTPANTNYLPILSSSIQTTETITIDGSPSFSFSDLEIINPTGQYDSWLDDIWNNRSVKLYIGEVDDTRANYNLIFDGLIDSIDSKSPTTLNIKIRDKLQRLNTSITETVLGGLSENAQSLIPYTWGECFNVSPLLVDNATSTYQFNGDIGEDVIEARVNGAPVAITKDLSNGKFSLNRKPTGEVTCSVQGRKPLGTYNKTIASVIQDIVLNFGKPADRFVIGDIDIVNFNAFDTANTQTIGYNVKDKENIISAITNLASSIQGQVLCNRLGKLQLHQIRLDGVSTRTIDEKDIIEKSLRFAERLLVKSTVMLHYCKNWTVQSNLKTGLANQSRSILANEFRLVTSNDPTVQGKYLQTAYPEPEVTYLVNKTEAQAEADRRLALWKVQRTIFEFEGTPNTSDLTIGQTITLKHSRFGLSAGKIGLVTSLTIDWKTLKTRVQVLV
jgi:hypothetical protein